MVVPFQVSDVHTLYFEEAGNPSGKPVVVLHGGMSLLAGSLIFLMG
jgi:hypothetical protein